MAKLIAGLFKPSSWKPWNRVGFEAAWKIGLPLGFIMFAMLLTWWLTRKA